MAPAQRQALQVLRMVHELHKQGYQLLRIAPGMFASGCHWRCAITPRSNILSSHGALLSDRDGSVAHYSSGQEDEYSGWADAKADEAPELAAKFLRRFPEIVERAHGDDWNYAGWYARMLGYAERAVFPVAYADWWEPPDPRFLPLWGHESDLPMPPPGDAGGCACPRGGSGWA